MASYQNKLHADPYPFTVKCGSVRISVRNTVLDSKNRGYRMYGLWNLFDCGTGTMSKKNQSRKLKKKNPTEFAGGHVSALEICLAFSMKIFKYP